MQLKSRTGDGNTKSSSSVIDLTFSFAPTFIIMLCDITSSSKGATLTFNHKYGGANCTKLTTSYVAMAAFTIDTTYNNFCKKSSDGKTVYWYPQNTDLDKMYYQNTSGRVYYYLAFA